MPRKLTDKQETYKNNRISGMDRKPAYKDAYSAEGMSDKSVAKEVEKLESHPVIAPLIAKARENAANKALVTVEDVVKGLLKETQEEADSSTSTSRINAWKTLSDYTGGFDANKQKVEHSGAIDGLTDEQLNKKLEALIAGTK